MKNRYLICIFFVFIVSCQTKNGYLNCNGISKSITDSIMTEKTQNTIFYFGKAVIPCLIEHIDDSKTVCLSSFINPTCSNIPEFICNNQIGNRYAYLIEFILSKATILPYENRKLRMNEWDEYIKQYRIFEYGIIVKNINKVQVLKSLNHNDMIEIKKIYISWWEKNKSKSIEQLRKEWIQNGSILNADSNYLWK